MTRGIGAIFLGAAVMSLFVPPPRTASRPDQAATPADKKAQTPDLVDSEAEKVAAPPARLLALVQTKPQVQILAISESREELERELLELNETWNHWQIRTERQRYEIQAAPVLRRADEPHRAGVQPV